MAARYWVGGTGTWSTTNTTSWSITSGGAGGASVPGSADTPIFDSNSGTGVVTKTTTTSVGAVTLNNPDIELSLGSAFTTSSTFTLSAGTLTTNNYTFTAAGITSNSGNARAMNFGSSTVSLSGTTTAWVVNSSGLTFNAGTSQINFLGNFVNLNETMTASGLTFHNVSFTNTSISTIQIYGSNTFNNLSFAGRATGGVSLVTLSSTTTQTVNGTLTLSAGINAAARTLVRSNSVGAGVAATLNCAVISSLSDIDFQSIAITGAASPISGTRLGDVRGNSGITFDAPKTVYWSATASASYGTASWASTPGGVGSFANFPLAQDTILFQASIPAAGTTLVFNAGYNIGTIDFSARTASITVSFSAGVTICGNWVNNSFVTISGSVPLTFSGLGSQTITSAGKAFSNPITISSTGGTVTLQDAFSSSSTSTQALYIQAGTFSANGYNVTLSAGGVTSNLGLTRTIDIGSGTWLIRGAGSTIWDCISTNLTVTGSGTIAVNNNSSRNFIGGGIQTYPHLRKDTSNPITILGSNKFARISNSVGFATGFVLFEGGSTNEFDFFDLNGLSTSTRITIGSTTTTQATLKKPTAWNVGTGSFNGGNNTGISFTAGDNNYLSISYINGVVPTLPSTANFLMFFM